MLDLNSYYFYCRPGRVGASDLLGALMLLKTKSESLSVWIRKGFSRHGKQHLINRNLSRYRSESDRYGLVVPFCWAHLFYRKASVRGRSKYKDPTRGRSRTKVLKRQGLDHVTVDRMSTYNVCVYQFTGNPFLPDTITACQETALQHMGLAVNIRSPELPQTLYSV